MIYAYSLEKLQVSFILWLIQGRWIEFIPNKSSNFNRKQIILCLHKKIVFESKSKLHLKQLLKLVKEIKYV